jgi:hypothetical protein
MATKKTDLTTTVLIQIRDGMRELGAKLDVTNARLDHLRDFMSDIVRDQRKRIDRLETRVDRIEAGHDR